MKLLQKLKNNKRGFSLVELIVVIAIMAVIAVVLIPSLLRNVEESRAEKDVKSTDELVSAVELSISDQDVYDELVEHSVLDNIACYIDKNSESEYTDNKTILKEGDVPQYTFDNDTRRLDESLYFGAGNIRGLTITFSPVKSSNESEYVLKDGIINKFVARSVGYLGDNQNLYNSIRQIVGDKLKLSSQTYRNSDFTVFIRMGSIGGNQASAQDAVQVWGQFNGTNLSSDTINTYKLTSDRTVGEAGLDDMKINLENQDDKLGFYIQYNLPSVYNEDTKQYKIECQILNENIFDVNEYQFDEKDFYNVRTGNVTTNKLFRKTSKFIPIRTYKNQTLYLYPNTGSMNTGLCFYDENENFISGHSSTKTTGVVVPENAYYIRLGYHQDSIDEVVVSLSPVSSYIPHMSQRLTLTSPVQITESDKLIKKNGLYGWSIIDLATGAEKEFYPLSDNEQKVLYDFEKSISQ